MNSPKLNPSVYSHPVVIVFLQTYTLRAGLLGFVVDLLYNKLYKKSTTKRKFCSGFVVWIVINTKRTSVGPMRRRACCVVDNLGTHPHQYFGWGGVNGNISPIFLRTFGYSRPILIVLAQWQHLAMSFIHCFARKSRIFQRIDPNLTKGAHDK